MGSRFTALTIVIVLAYGFIFFHLYDVQILHNRAYQAQAASQYQASLGLSSSDRGTIFFTDKDGNQIPAAVNQQVPIIYAVPSVITDVTSTAAEAAQLLGQPLATLESEFANKKSSYVLLDKTPSQTEAAQVDAADLKGVYTEPVAKRDYPFNTLASQVIGFVGPDPNDNGVSGKYGVEKLYNAQLSGSSNDAADPTANIGQSIVLTIDPNVQLEAEQIVNNLITQSGATGGSFMVEAPQTGKIVAMGSEPDFDPNAYGQSPLSTFLNPNVQAVYEPGSIFKVLTMAAGIDAGKITPNTTYDDKGYVNVDGAHITNYNLTTYGAYGPNTSMTEVIEHSINSGAIFAENQTGNAVFTEYMHKFRLDQSTDIDLPGEVTGDLTQLNPKSPQVDFDTAAYGQGVAVSPVELMTAIDAIANNGVMMRPYVNAASQPQVLGRAISASTAQQVTGMMTAAIDDVPGAPAISGYSLAGKTGSAFIPNAVHGGYTDQLIDSYIGFGPTTNPQFIVFIRLNTLPETSLAVDTVVPGFKQLTQYLINYYNIPPDRVNQ